MSTHSVIVVVVPRSSTTPTPPLAGSEPDDRDGRRAAPLPPAARRAAIIEAVLPVLAEHGDAVTTRQLASAAGVSEGTIFNVFADKDELLRAAVDTAVAVEPFEHAVAGVDPELSFEAMLTAVVEITQRRIVEIWRLVSRLGPRYAPTHGPLPASPALVARLRAHATELRADPDEAARLLRSMTLSCTHPQLVAEPLPAGRIVDVLLRGIGAER